MSLIRFRTSAALLLLLLLTTPLHAAPGLIARYSDGKSTVTTTVPLPAFALKENESPHPQVATIFTADYDGTIKLLRRGAYTFTTTDGATLKIDDKEVTAPTELEAGDHPISLHFERKTNGPSRLQVTWSSDQFLPEPLPTSVLTHTPIDAVTTQLLVERGRLIVEEHNCAACHKQGANHLSASRTAPDLTNIGNRTTAAWIAKWLENPQHFRPGAVMPITLTKPEDRRDVAAYLATLKDSRKKVNQLKPSQSKAKQGKELFETIGCANCHQGPLALEGLGSKWDLSYLAAYLKDPLAIDRSGRMPSMLLSDEESAALANHLMTSRNPEYEARAEGEPDPERGRGIFRSTGCLNCHTLEGAAGKPIPDAAARPIPALDKLDPTKGCIGEKDTPAGVPHFTLTASDDRAAVVAFLQSIKTTPLISSAPAHDFHRTLQRFNCVACHATEISTPGEDVEHVPPLTHVGNKLRRDWIAQVLGDKRARVRFWLKTRMPDFGGNAVSKIPDQALAAAGSENAPVDDKLLPTTAQVASGQKLVGNNDPQKNPTGLGCVTCHSLREFKPAVAADATRGPELTLMTTRLRPDFFRRWMHDPARIQPGTAMPNFFHDKPREEADQTIDTLWAYASLGIGMPAPVGVKEKKNYILIVTDTPIVSRCQVPDPNGTIVYGISVGLPGMVNYTFDAEHVMLRTAWQGGFLDMTGDWADRGGNPVRVLGKRFYEVAINPLRIGDPDAIPIFKFKGYELKDKIPTFLYTLNNIEVRERITATGEGKNITLTRTFDLDPQGQNVYLLHPDDPNNTIIPSQGQFKPAQVQKTFKSPEKTPGQLLELPGNNRLTVSITIKPK